MGILLKAISALAALCWLALATLAQLSCSLAHCHGPSGDGWMPVIFLAPLGLPALMYTIVTVMLAFVGE